MEIGSAGKTIAAGVVVAAAVAWVAWTVWPRDKGGAGTMQTVPDTFYCEQCKQPFTLEGPLKPGEQPVCPSCKAASGRPMYEYLCGRCRKVYQSPLPLDQYPMCPHCNQCDPREVPPDAKGGGKTP